MRSELFAGLLVGLVATDASAFIAPSKGPEGVKVKSTVIRPSTYQSDVSAFSVDDANTSLDRRSNSVRYMRGRTLLDVQVTEFTKKAFEEAALQAVESRADVFGVSMNDVRVNRKATHVDQEDQSVSLHVYREGLPIQDAGITLRFKFGHLTSIKSETFSEAVIAPSLVANTADIAMKALNSSGYVATGSKWRVVPTNAGYSLVKVDEFIVAGADAPWVVQVNKVSGELYDVRSKNFNLRGRAVATAYPRFHGDRMKETPLPHSSISNASSRANERGEFQSSDDFSAPKMEGLSGQYVMVKNESGNDLSATASKSGNQWNLKFDIEATDTAWDNNDMAQAMVYISTNQVISAAKKFIQPTWFNAPITANVNHSKHCNAYWDGETINFFTAGEYDGKTCANTGMIADVVYHEWGHGLDDNTGGIEDGALSEGFGDALAALFTDDAKVGIDFMPLTHKSVRDLETFKKFPEDVVDEVHADGLIFGGAMWDMYKELKRAHGVEKGKNLYAKFLFKGIYEYTKMSDAYDAILTLDDNDRDLSNGTPNLCIINKAFARHGLAEADSSCR